MKGKPGYKITTGAGRENLTTMACVNAAGRVLAPLFIFAGKNFQNTWVGDKALPGTYYGVSENGWMTSEVIADWFDKFCVDVKERPLLLIFDGHLSHVSIRVIEKAMEEQITLLKFPPHVTDVMQPLDIACFGPLKRRWETLLNSWTNEWGPKEVMKKGQSPF